MIKYVFKLFIFIFLCIIGVYYNQKIVLADTFPSEYGKTCSQICAENNKVCQNISTADDEINYSYCGFNENEECANIGGDCSTILENTYLTCFDRITNKECGVDLNKYLNWTNCNCTAINFSTLEIQPIDGQQDYLTATSVAPYINSYQPFDDYIFHDDNNHNPGNWTNIQAVLFRAKTSLGGDTRVDVFLKMALGSDNYTANCDGDYGIDWAWSPIGKTTIAADGVWRDTAVFKDQNDDQCAYYNETYFCTICGIGFYTYPDEGTTFVELGQADYPKFQLDIAGERVSDYSLWFLLAGTKNSEPESACNCASSSNIFFQGICEGFCYLFIPTDYGLTSFQNNYNNLKQAFPFNTYFQLTTAVQDGLNNANLDTNSTIGVPMVRKAAGAAQFYIQPVLSSSSLPNAIGGTNANLIRNTLSYLFWLVGAGLAVILFIKF